MLHRKRKSTLISVQKGSGFCGGSDTRRHAHGSTSQLWVVGRSMCYNNTIRPETREAPNLKQGTMRRPRDKSTSTWKLTTTTTTMTTSATTTTMMTMVMTILVRAVFFHSHACRNVVWAIPLMSKRASKPRPSAPWLDPVTLTPVTPLSVPSAPWT